jgi:excisionase family DNA binding protein
MAQGLLTSKEVAARLGIHPVTLKRWRQEGKGPAYYQFGGKGPCRYKERDVDQWLALNRKEGG